MHTVCLSLDWLKLELQSAGLRLEDEAPRPDVLAYQCEPWFNVERGDESWIVQGCFATREVIVMESDGREVLRIPSLPYSVAMRGAVLGYMGSRLGEMLWPINPELLEGHHGRLQA